ncbi:hypothetical protein Taro_001611 [Colocasia esculenta]|uniref:Maternal effect embryo arrest 60 n=1 Tax=Colocasia esculenta TaxID=4460 RepID=A0A843TE21_COLES|nr:hypothetical protein [Colocasia esculenta]
MEEYAGRRTPDDGHEGRGTSIHVTALDGIVNVNSLFTLGVFVGLAWNPTDPSNSLADSECAAGNSAAEDMVSFHVFSFSCFLFSSLVALCLKQAIRLVRQREGIHIRGIGRWWEEHAWGAERVNRAMLRVGIVVSAVGSVFGCGFLMMALVNVVQVKLGRLGCAGASAGAIVPLVILVPTAMLIYLSIVFYAFTR